MSDSPKRRTLQFNDLSDILADVEQLAVSENVQTLGNYSFAQILKHLAITMDVASGHDIAPIKVAFPMRILIRIMRPLMLNMKMRPGFKLPSDAESHFWPSDDVDLEQAIQHFRDAVKRHQATDPLPSHPFFGSMNRPQHNKLQCRHCELHLSFVLA